MRNLVVAVGLGVVASAFGLALFLVVAIPIWNQIQPCLPPRTLIALPCDPLLEDFQNLVAGWALISAVVAVAVFLALLLLVRVAAGRRHQPPAAGSKAAQSIP